MGTVIHLEKLFSLVPRPISQSLTRRLLVRTPIIDQLDQLPTWLQQQGQPSFRAGQIIKWIFQQRARSFAEMTDLPQALRAALDEHYTLTTVHIEKHDQAADGTEKLLVQLQDGGLVECVLLREGDRRSICVSSQVGCAMGCVFCASGLDGVMRNLTSGEILEQMLCLQKLLPDDERLSHIVMMGMGEPLANLENVVQALAWASRDTGLGISPRRVTISTVGLPPAIEKLARTDSRFHLAISLHAPNDELRNELVPVNQKIGIRKLLQAADDYFTVSGRKLTFEYVLLADINDQPEHAHQLARLLQGRTAILNVIPYNPVQGLPYRTPSSRAIRQFREILQSAKIVVKFRQRKGDKINAACGQLRRQKVQPLQGRSSDQ
ncbi:MAG: 23S rRNA (adenine(2503)-C(2))-methyltransferase RlmN [Mariniblastus sp.]|nr:23S rRNA (adenine(2503)-C(2))-methyltransferase RlmN [Mariniblastus sp.]